MMGIWQWVKKKLAGEPDVIYIHASRLEDDAAFRAALAELQRQKQTRENQVRRLHGLKENP